MNEIFPGVFRLDNKLWTQNKVPGVRVYGEKLLNQNGIEYRNWNPYKSKLAAGIEKGLKQFPIEKNSSVLYLGSAEGTTASHLSDILIEGVIVGVEFSSRSMPKFLELCGQRENMIPVLADANQPGQYPLEIQKTIFDVLFQDISQKNQAEIFLKNSELLKKNGFGFLVIKAPSIDSAKNAETVVTEQTKQLKPAFDIIQTVSLEPFESKHALILAKKK
ncbi:MAG: fibrillarin-like rRNA/tRNA 2'-O-methyltransferase [Candidatus Micrarchaeota archaeon]